MSQLPVTPHIERFVVSTRATAYTYVSMTGNVMTVFVLCGALLASACTHGQVADASCNLEPPDLPKLLQAIRPLIEKGYGEQEIATVQRLWESTPLKSTGAKTFPITHRRQSATMRVELKKDDVDEIEIWFITTPELAREIQAKMRQFRDLPKRINNFHKFPLTGMLQSFSSGRFTHAGQRSVALQWCWTPGAPRKACGPTL